MVIKKYIAATENEAIALAKAKLGEDVTMIVNENKVKIKCLNNSALIGSSFKLVCTVDDVLSELLVNIVGGV